MKKKRRRSKRGNWLVVTYYQGEIFFCRWVRSWAGVQMSKRNAQKCSLPSERPEIIIVDIDRMAKFAMTIDAETAKLAGISARNARQISFDDE